MKKNDLATLKCKYNDLLEQPKNENTNGEPLINQIKQFFDNWEGEHCAYYNMLSEFLKYYDEYLKVDINEKLNKLTQFNVDIREFFCIKEEAKTETFLTFLIDLNKRH